MLNVFFLAAPAPQATLKDVLNCFSLKKKQIWGKMAKTFSAFPGQAVSLANLESSVLLKDRKENKLKKSARPCVF